MLTFFTTRHRLVLICVLLIGCSKPDIPEKQWYKGNLHTHSYWSDGDEFPEVITDWYKARNYQFLAFTEHNTIAEGEKWKSIASDSLYMEAFERYREDYGDDWVIFREDSLGRTQVKLKTLAEFRGRFEEKGRFLLIQSEEITDGFEGRPLHLNATNVQRKIEPQGGNSVVDVLQNNIDAVNRQREETGVPMFPHINHPNFGFAISLRDMMALRNERFFEVYNGHHMVHNSGDSTHISTERMWDLINIAYLNNHQPLIYGMATDDSHHYHKQGRQWSNAGRGWVQVHTDSLSAEAIITAMENGDFYASTGVELEKVAVNDQLAIRVKEEPGVRYSIEFIGCRVGNSEPEVFMQVEGTEASFEITNEVLFVRAKITSSRLHSNPIEDLLYESAWTQPVQSPE